MNLTQEDRDCLIAYSRKSENLPSALAIWAIQEDLRVAIMTEFLEELRECVTAGLKKRKLPWCISPVQIKEKDYKTTSWVPILSMKRKESEREIILYKEGENWRTYLGGKCYDESALTREQLKPALVGVGTGGGYNTSDGGFEWWRRIEKAYRDLNSDKAITTMNLEKERKDFVEHYCEVLLKAVEGIEGLI